MKRLPPGSPLVDRLANRLTITERGCWETDYRVGSKGYALVQVDGQPRGVHRAAYDLLVGDCPVDQVADHLCRNRKCFNPDHLEPVTHRENLMRGDTAAARNAVKTHCDRGHEFDSDNTVMVNKGRHRRCRTCFNDWQRVRRANRKGGSRG